MVGEEGVSRWHMPGFGMGPLSLLNTLQMLEMVVGIAAKRWVSPALWTAHV